MDINIRLKIDAPTGWQRRLLLYVVTPLALVAATAAIAHATIDTTWIGDGKQVSASKLQANLNDLDARLTKPTITRNGKTYSLGASYCGSTASTSGALGQYAGAKATCEAACGASASAHMCSSDEVIRSRALGVAVPDGWYSTAEYSNTASGAQNDCNGWGNGTAGYAGGVWATGTPSFTGCDVSHVTLCCD